MTADSSPYPIGARSFVLKIWRANIHLQQLRAEVTGWRDAALQTLDEQPDPEGSGYYAAWVTPPAPDHAAISLLAGDCLQCLRSALDHLAFELASAFTIPMTDAIEKWSEFPIFGDKDGKGDARFHQLRSKGASAGSPAFGSGRAKIQGMDPLAQAEIERLQPYQRGNQYESDPLWLLSALNNIDKHRTLHVVGAAMNGARMPLPEAGIARNVSTIGFPDREWPLYIASEIAVEGRTKVARWPAFAIDPTKKMYVGFQPVLDIAFNFATPHVAGESVANTLGRLHDYVLTDVIPPLDRFLN